MIFWEKLESKSSYHFPNSWWVRGGILLNTCQLKKLWRGKEDQRKPRTSELFDTETLKQFSRHIYQILSIIYYLHTYAAGARWDCFKWHGGVYRDSCQPRPATPPPPPPLCSIKHGGGPAWRRQLAAAAGRGSRRRSAACPSPSTGVSVMHSSQ